ncbi:unnamed protein product [Amaranthus hypochondriacus]
MNYYGQKLRYGGFVPVDPSSPNIQEIASWAISKYNNEHGRCMKYLKAIKAEQQLNAGVKYRIDLEASYRHDNGSVISVKLGKYQVLVYQDFNKQLNLHEFKPLL